MILGHCQAHSVLNLRSTRSARACLCSILGASLSNKQRDTSIRKTAHLQRMSTMLTQRRLHVLGHTLRMTEDHPPRKLFVCAPSHGKRSAGGQRMRWNDQVLRDLRSSQFKGNWKTLTQNRNDWRRQIWTEISHLNDIKETEEKHCKNVQKRHCEARQTSSALALKCTVDGCGFTAMNHAGLVNYQRQKHGPSLTGQCQICHQVLNQQSLQNQERFCYQRTSTPAQLQ